MAGFLVSCLLAAAAALAHAQPVPVEEFFKRPDYIQLKLSPDGTLVAAIVRGTRRDTLAVLDVNAKKGRPITNFADADVLNVHWISKKRLVFSVGDAHEAASNAEFYGWYAVDIDGSALEQIAVPAAAVRYLHPIPGGGDEVILEMRWRGGADVVRFDTRAVKVTGGGGGGSLRNVTDWTLDRRGIPRVARSSEEGRERISYRDGPGKPWRILEGAEQGKLSFWPLGIAGDGTFYVGAYEKDSDRSAIYRYDLENNRVGERVARHLDFSMDRVLISGLRGRLLGFTYAGERVIWVDEQMARLQRMVDRALPDTSNGFTDISEGARRALVTAHSDVTPPTFYLLDTEKLTLEKFASSRPWLKPAEMSERKFVTYKARDGLEIPAYLTVPKGSSHKNLPLVVEIHGGPWIERQTSGFNLHAQFFASRGYAVLQPDFRGTVGYSKRHYEASFGQWGLAMQDDITDGVEWLISQGIADKNRVCLIGASYGGYATLWGLMKTPELYRCGVAYLALTDISYYFKFNRWDMGRSLFADYGARTMIGDPDRDAEKFKSVSPVAQAERLKAAVLLAYGGSDQRVPISNGTALRARLDRYGKKYEWVEYPEEGHGFNNDKNRFDFYRRVELFLQQHLSDPAKLN